MNRNFIENASIVEYVYLDGDKQCVKVYNENENPNMYLVPINAENTDYQTIQQWVADGGTITDNPPE